MRLAVLADIHGHFQALEAVLADARQHAVHQHLVLGDLVNRFVQPRRVLERVATLKKAHVVHGNGDLFVAEYGRPGWNHDWPGAGEIARWHRQRIGDAWAAYLRRLPDHCLLELGDLPSMLMTHALPGDPYRGILPQDYARRVRLGEPLPPWAARPEHVRNVLSTFDVPLALTGHTHRPGLRTIAGCQVLNPGAVMGLLRPDRRAEYLLLDLGSNGSWQARWRAVPYDMEATLASLEPLVRRLPHVDRLAARLREALASNHQASEAAAVTFLREEQPA